MEGFLEKEIFDLGPEGSCVLPLAHSERLVVLLGQKEDVEKALLA